MKLTRSSLLLLVAVGGVLVGCDRSQDIPEGASYKDPMGINAKNAKAGEAAPSKMQTDQANAAQKTGEDMKKKYGGGG